VVPRRTPIESPSHGIDALMGGNEIRDGVTLTNLDEPLFEGANATKRDLVDYVDAVADRLIAVLSDRPLSVIRVARGGPPFMQKNVPKYTPQWVRTVSLWAETSKRDVSYALCNDRRTLLWFANQRAVEYHPTLVRADGWDHVTHMVLDLDPPDAGSFPATVRAAHLVRQALSDAGLTGALKTSGAKGLHVFVPIDPDATIEDAAAATRALGWTPHWRRRRSFGRTARARCSSIRPGPAEPRLCRRTVRESGPARPCRSRWGGTSSIGSRRGSSPSTAPSGWSAIVIRGPSRCRPRSDWTPLWSKRDAGSRSVA
jgi:DNA ligase D-like protein (predicted polymerase)